jgi:hypothetical protein
MVSRHLRDLCETDPLASRNLREHIMALVAQVEGVRVALKEAMAQIAAFEFTIPLYPPEGHEKYPQQDGPTGGNS